MSMSKYTRNAITAGLLVLFATVGAWAEDKDVLSGSSLLRAIRERSGKGIKPAYEERSKEPITAKEPVEEPNAGEVSSKPMAKSKGDQLLAIVPADSLFCVRVNNFDYTVNQIDQFLAGISPMPMGLSMLVRMQLAKFLGSPELNGVNMGGSFAIFGVAPIKQSAEPQVMPKLLLAGLVPVTDYKQFITGNPSVGQPDEKGVSKITSEGMPVMLALQAGKYALISSADNYDTLVGMAKPSSAGKISGIVTALDAAEVKQAIEQPIWAYGNVQQARKSFGTFVLEQLKQAETAMEEMKSAGMGSLGSATAIMDMYAGILETLMKETKSLSIAVKAKPNVLNITSVISAVPGTDMADMFVGESRPSEGLGEAGARQENRLLGYLEDGAVMNFAGNMNIPLWKKFNDKCIDLIIAMAGDSVTEEDIAKMKTTATDWISAIGGPAAFSFSIDAKNKPPFVCKYVMAVKDPYKFNKVMDEAIELFSTGGIAGFYKTLGMEVSYTVKHSADKYKGVSIDSAKLVMKSVEPNSPAGLMMERAYGGGFDYRWSIVDGLYVCAMGGDVDSAIWRLIDQVKAGGQKQMASEIKAALAILPEAETADFIATYNYVRLFKMMTTMMPAVGGVGATMPQVDISTKSNIAFVGKVGDGKVTLDVAVPKEHLTEIMAVFQMMLPKKMPTQGPPTGLESLAKIRQVDQQMKSAKNLQAIGKALILYASNHEEKYPPNLEVLVEEVGLSPEKLVSPLKPNEFDGPSYIYIAGQSAEMDPQNIIAYENPEFCSDRINVLYNDCHVMAEEPVSFFEDIKATYERLGREMPAEIQKMQQKKEGAPEQATKDLFYEDDWGSGANFEEGTTAGAVAAGSQTVIKQLQDGDRKERSKDFDGAIKVYEGITENTEANQRHIAQAYYRLGVCYLKKGEKDKALEQFRHLVSEYPRKLKPVGKARRELRKLGVDEPGKEPKKDKPTSRGRHLSESSQRKKSRSIEQALGGALVRQKYGPEETVKLEIIGVTNDAAKQQITKQLQKMADSRNNRISYRQVGDTLIVELSPVKDVERFTKKIRFGTVTSVEARQVTVEIRRRKRSN